MPLVMPGPARLPSLAGLLLLLVPVFAQALSPTPPYVLADKIELGSLLSPPPSADSAAGKADLQAVLDIQRSRTEADLALAKADSEASVFRFADSLGAGFSAANLPKTAQLFDRLTRSVGAVVGPAKDYWNRARPFVASSEVQPTSRPEGTTYPSGHATLARLYAIVLAELLPQQRAAIFERADRFARGRLVGGVHYPSDVEAGTIAATVIAAELRHQEAFRLDLAAAKAEIATWQAASSSTAPAPTAATTDH